MKKIASLFKRDYEGNRQVLNEVVEGSEWVLEGEGVATIKHDGTACMIKDGELYKRYDVKKGREVPEGAIACESKANEHTGHWPHWVKVGEGKEDKWFRDADIDGLPDGTYELVGEKINGNKENVKGHQLVKHGILKLPSVPRDFMGIRIYLESKNIEGIVWHHPDGRMVKIKKRDFGYKW